MFYRRMGQNADTAPSTGFSIVSDLCTAPCAAPRPTVYGIHLALPPADAAALSILITSWCSLVSNQRSGRRYGQCNFLRKHGRIATDCRTKNCWRGTNTDTNGHGHCDGWVWWHWLALNRNCAEQSESGVGGVPERTIIATRSCSGTMTVDRWGHLLCCLWTFALQMLRLH